MTAMSLQERYAPHDRCFGCGNANEKGLRLKSHVDGEVVRATWRPESHYEAFDGILNGGIIGALLDCHSNWTAAWHLMQQSGSDKPPCTVTASYEVRFRQPTPSTEEIELEARVSSSAEDRATVDAALIAGGRVCATCRGTFVAVKPGHPAYHQR